MADPRLRTDRLLVVDLELTCWAGAPPAGEAAEIIEIGVVEIDAPDLRVSRAKRYLVRPCRSQVSDFCAAFTGLDAATLQREGRPYAEVANGIRKEFGTPRKVWMAWGQDDRALAAEERASGTPSPFSGGFVDLCLLWTQLTGSGALASLEDALATAGLAPQGHAHSALDDATNAARVWLDMARRWRVGIGG
jgi:inhibitor of KinA sporulation pathway (predicted exonuclease)